MRISGQDLVSLVFELSHYSLSLSLSYSWLHRVFLQHSWRVWHTWILGARRHQHQQLHQIFLQVPSCMYDFFTSFGIHGTCMWFLGYDLSLAWRIAWIDNGFAQPHHFLDSHGVCGFTFYQSLQFPRLKRKSRRVTSNHFNSIAIPTEHERDLSKYLINDMTLKQMNFRLYMCICS